MGRIIWRLAGALALLAAVAYHAAGQEKPLSLNGNWMGGYSGVSDGSGMSSGPYVGFDAVATGFWKDSRILNYSVAPSWGRGLTGDGVAGPLGEGVSANSTFLGGSRMPLALQYSYHFMPAPDISTTTTDYQGVALTRKDFGVDWNTNLRYLPPIQISFHKSSDSSETPHSVTMENHSRDVLVSTSYRFLGWALSGNYSNNHGGSTGAMNASSAFATFADSRAQSLSGIALHALPRHSTLLVDGGWSSTALQVADAQSASNYKHASVSLNSQPISRLSLSGHASYISSISDFLLAGLLASQTSTQSPTQGPSVEALGAPLRLLGGEVLTYGAGASIRLMDGLSVNANYNATEPLSSTGQSSAGGMGQGAGAGVSYNRTIWRGQFFSTYNHYLSQSQTNATAGSATTSNSSGDAVIAGYSHPLPYGITSSVSANYSVSRAHYLYDDNLHFKGLDFQAHRRVGLGWTVTSLLSYRTGSHEYPTHQEDGSKSLSVSLDSSRLQLSGALNRTTGLAYRFGSHLVFVPGTSELINPTGLPPLTQSSSNSYNLSATYRVSRRLSVSGAYYLGSSSADGAPGNLMSGYDTRARLRFRQVWLVGGYRRDLRSSQASTIPAYARQSFYVMVRREFRVF